MSISLCFGGTSPGAIRIKMMMRGGTYLALPLVLSACSKGLSVDSCTYLDAFEKEVALEEFTNSKGREDALKMVSKRGLSSWGDILRLVPSRHC